MEINSISYRYGNLIHHTGIGNLIPYRYGNHSISYRYGNLIHHTGIGNVIPYRYGNQ